MRLRDLLDNETVKIDLESVDKEECFEEMVDILVRAGRITDRAAALKAIFDREAQGTTGIGKGIAVPHGKHKSVSKLIASCGISREGIEFDAVDGEPVHLVVLLLANINQPGPHLQALVEIARLVKIPGFYRRVTQVTSAAEFLDILDAEE
jgi:mannitol/fructose-specific phosphotransferase system IIA component (Ntr-type)